MLTLSKLEQFDAQLEELRLASPRRDLTAFVRAALDTAQDKEEEEFFLSTLAHEYAYSGRFDEAESTIRKQLEVAPDSPVAWVQLASHFLYNTRELKKALSAAEIAVEHAEAQGGFVRYTHGVRIRIALEIKKYEIVEASLVKLVEYTPEQPEIRLEDDFISRIPERKVNKEIVDRYKERVARESGQLRTV